MESVVLTNMCMVSDGQGQVLVQSRTDKGWPGIVYPGGHIEKGESITASVIREVREETGLTLYEPRLCGIKQFPVREGRYLVFLFRADRYTGTLTSSEEGKVFWTPRDTLELLPLAENFADMLPLFENDRLSELYYTENDNTPFLF